MKITATVTKTTEIDLEVDDKFNKLTSEDFWHNFEKANKLAEELLDIVEYSDNSIDKIYDIYDANGILMVEN